MGGSLEIFKTRYKLVQNLKLQKVQETKQITRDLEGSFIEE